MATISISAASHALLSARSSTGFIYPVRKQSDGRFLIEVDDEVMARLDAIDQDPDLAIAIACSGLVGNA